MFKITLKLNYYAWLTLLIIEVALGPVIQIIVSGFAGVYGIRICL